MLWSDLIIITFFLVQTGIGLLGNSILLLLYVGIVTSHPGQKKPADLILSHLTVANTVMLLTQSVPGMVVAFGMNNILDDAGCLIVIYIRRVARGLSISTTCLLSTFQAITISPSTSLWAKLRPRVPNCIIPSFLFFWALNLLIYLNILKDIAVMKNTTLLINGYSMKLCPNTVRVHLSGHIAFISIPYFRDLFFVFLMSWASGYMIITLHQHRKKVQHVHIC
ncbi:olfactory receptor class A-like protein 1 [Tachyglossus aculeatus]|uniref:olfactory receptor class A-like protein 1 n=1 Tax=Tachyglossus aculeatus TaxID=9261 RepID=UPI0018F79040|nr:olfactory receptor class A-like protein 1 [Tachyglossus aculeatus]